MAKQPCYVLYCPSEEHKKPHWSERYQEEIITPRKLLIVHGDKILVQCRDTVCRKYSDNHGWFAISKNETGGYSARALPKSPHPKYPLNLNLQEMPIMILEPYTMDLWKKELENA